MNAIENYELGEVFEIQVNKRIVRTKVQEIISDTEFIVLQPTINGMPIRAEDNEFTFLYHRKNGCVSFRARILYSYKEGELALSRVVRVSELKRTQRRQFYRLPIMLGVTISICDENDKTSGDEHKEETRFYKGKTVDLSENSVKICCYKKFAKGTKLIVGINLTESDSILVNAEVLFYEKLPDSGLYNTVLLFAEQSEREKAYIRRYIFKQQSLMLKRR